MGNKKENGVEMENYLVAVSAFFRGNRIHATAAHIKTDIITDNKLFSKVKISS